MKAWKDKKGNHYLDTKHEDKKGRRLALRIEDGKAHDLVPVKKSFKARKAKISVK